MMTLLTLIKRNTKIYFKDKAMFFTSMITPLILLVLYTTFLKNIYYRSYQESFTSFLPETFSVPDSLINGLVGGQLLSSLLAVCCVTVSFMSNLLMVQDKVTHAKNDLTIAPVKKSTLAVSYYIASMLATLFICLIATGIGLLYLRTIGWYLSIPDLLYILSDVFLLVLFGTALSSVIHFFLSSQGQITAVGAISSSCYGFICGAYMPISNFGDTLQNVLAFLPSTYGTSLIRNHTMQGVFQEMEALGFPSHAIENIRDLIDCNIYFFDHVVPISMMYLILIATIVVLLAAYIILHFTCKNTKK